MHTKHCPGIKQNGYYRFYADQENPIRNVYVEVHDTFYHLTFDEHTKEENVRKDSRIAKPMSGLVRPPRGVPPSAPIETDLDIFLAKNSFTEFKQKLVDTGFSAMNSLCSLEPRALHLILNSIGMEESKRRQFAEMLSNYKDEQRGAPVKGIPVQ